MFNNKKKFKVTINIEGNDKTVIAAKIIGGAAVVGAVGGVASAALKRRKCQAAPQIDPQSIADIMSSAIGSEA